MARRMWAYDAGEPYSNKKHGWAQNYAGVEAVRYGRRFLRVSCCPKGITREQAEEILNTRLPYSDQEIEQPDRWPDRVFCVHDGVPYEARPTHGRSFHAFPVLPERFHDLPLSVRDYLTTRAADDGRRLVDWLNRWKP